MAKISSPQDIPLTPRENPQLFGQEAAELLLLEAWNSGRMPHAWLLTGAKGTGKATLAFRFARFALSGHGDADFNLSPTHPIFQRIRAGSHGDLLVLEQKDGKEISVEDARKIAAFLRLTPAESAWRVVIIDSIDSMSRNAANAILKILEEPPANALILLISHMPGRILPTIRSRCRGLRLNPLNEACFTQILPQLEQSERRLLYTLSQGSPGIALSLWENGGVEYYTRLLALLANPSLLACHALGDEVSGKNAEATWEALTYLFGYFFHQLARYAAGMPLAMPAEQPVMAAFLRAHPLEVWMERWERLRQSLEDVSRINLDRKQVLVNALNGLRG